MAFETAAAIDREADCVLAFAAVQPHLSPDENDLLHNINRIGNAVPRTRTIEALAPYLPPNLIADVFAASRAIGDEEDRARALVALAPHLGPNLIPEALAAANAIKDENNRTRALTALAPRHLPPEQVTKLLVELVTAAESNGEEWKGVVIIGAVASVLSPDERAKALTEGFAIAKVIYNTVTSQVCRTVSCALEVGEQPLGVGGEGVEHLPALLSRRGEERSDHGEVGGSGG